MHSTEVRSKFGAGYFLPNILRSSQGGFGMIAKSDFLHATLIPTLMFIVLFSCESFSQDRHDFVVTTLGGQPALVCDSVGRMFVAWSNINGVYLGVFDVLGRQVAFLVNETRRPGSHTVKWDASRLPSGIYFARLEAAGMVMTRKMCLVK